MADHYVYFVIRVATPSALMEEQVRKCTYDDPTLQAVIQMTQCEGRNHCEPFRRHGNTKHQTCDSEKSLTTSVELSP